MKKTVLVTGGAGFIGSHLVHRLVERGDDVHVILLAGSEAKRLKDIDAYITWHDGDIRDRERVFDIFRKVNPQGIFHLAVSTILSGVTASSEELIAINVGGTVNILDAAVEHSRDFIITFGSFLEYGTYNRPVRESDHCAPGELYSITKLASTLYASALGKAKKHPVTTLRLFTPYGPGIQPGRLIYTLIEKALKNEDIALTDPKVTRDFIFVDDIVDLALEAGDRVGECGGEIFNVGNGVAVSLDAVVKLVLQKTGSQSKLQWNAFRSVAYDSERWQADMTKTFAQFKWRPKHSLEEGISKTIEWYKAHKSIKQ